MKKTLLTLCAVVGSLLPFTAPAQNYYSNPCCDPCPAPCTDNWNPPCDPWYLYAGVVHTGNFEDRYVLTQNSAVRDKQSHTNNLGWEVFLGYNFNRCFGVELGFVDFYRDRAREVTSLASQPPVGHFTHYVVPLRGKFSLEFCDLSFSALFGIHYYNLHGTLTSTDTTVSLNRLRSGVDFNFGAAIEYRFIEWLGLRVDLSRYYYTRFDAHVSDYVDAITGNLVTYF